MRNIFKKADEDISTEGSPWFDGYAAGPNDFDRIMKKASKPKMHTLTFEREDKMDREDVIMELASLIASREIPRKVFNKYISEDSPIAFADEEDVYNYLIDDEDDMTVGQLINRLEKYNSDAKIHLKAHDEDEYPGKSHINVITAKDEDGDVTDIYVTVKNYEEE